MAQYKEKPTRWCEAKALTFFINFIKNDNVREIAHI